MSIFSKGPIPGRKLSIFLPEKKKLNPQQIHCCASMNIFLQDKRMFLNYSSTYREYDIPLLYKRQATALQGITYCPWCSKKLPKSLRHEWFVILEKEYGINDPFDREQEKLIPEEFNSDEWWKKRGL